METGSKQFQAVRGSVITMVANNTSARLQPTASSMAGARISCLEPSLCCNKRPWRHHFGTLLSLEQMSDHHIDSRGKSQPRVITLSAFGGIVLTKSYMYRALLLMFMLSSNMAVRLRRLTCISRAVTCTRRAHDHHALEPRMEKFMGILLRTIM